jgi:hypothetical protein
MPGTISHALSMTSPNDPLYENQPKHWNSSHLVTLNLVGSEVSGAFGNAGGVTFGYDGTNVTAAAGTAAPSPVNISAGTTSNNLGSIVFGDSNGISFGLGTGASSRSITATVKTDYLTSQSNQNALAGNGNFNFQTLSFSNANNFTFATSAGSAIVGSYTVPTVTNSSWTVSDAASSATVGRLAFTNLNGITLSLSTGAAGSHTIVGSHNALTSQSNQALSASNGSFTFQTAAFSNANGVTFGTSAGSIVSASVKTDYAGTGTSATNASITLNTAGLAISVAAPGAAAENNAINLLGANTAGNTTATGSTIGWSGVNLTFSGTNNSQVVVSGPGTSSLSATGYVSLSVNGSTISIGAPSMAVSNSAGSFLFTTLNFSNANNVTWGTSAGSIVTASVGAGAGGVAVGVSNTGNTAGNTGTNSSGTIVFAGSGAITASQSTGAGQSTIWYSVPQTSSIVGTNGISISTNGSTISVLPNWVSSFENMEGLANSATSTWNGASVSHAVAFFVPWAVSMSFIRVPISMTTQSTTISTIASNTASAQAGITHTFNAGIYSIGVGGSSQSLQNVTTGTATYVVSMKVSVTSSTRASYSLAFSGQANGGQTSLSTQYSVSNTNYSFTTDQIATNFSGLRFLDIPCAASLSPGAYWMIIGMSSNSSSAGNTAFTAMTNCNVVYSNHYAATMQSVGFGIMGSTNFTSGGLFGAGSFSTAGGGTTNSLPISAISSNASQAMIYFQMLRSV